MPSKNTFHDENEILDSETVYERRAYTRSNKR